MTRIIAGMSAEGAALMERHLGTAAAAHRARTGADAHGAWWVPGRIEVLGKHTDYAGGRSLLCAVERGFCVVSSPRDDSRLVVTDAATERSATLPVAVDTPPTPGAWTDYPVSVVRRLARDLGATRGATVTFSSSLPRASGLSSSSALVIATFLPLAHANRLDGLSAYRAVLDTPGGLAGYLGAVENGKAFGPFAPDHGVGLHGGSEDQAAILHCRAGALEQYRFLPVTHEATVPLPEEWTFVVAMSGVHAEKGGAAQAHYNALAAETAALLERWNARSGRHDASLLQALEHGGRRAIEALLPAGDPLLDRLEQFSAESEELIPAMTSRLMSGDVAGIAPLVARSQDLARRVLRNQVDETIALVDMAAAAGAIAASAFGAGFGGSVWALAPTPEASAVRDAWAAAYLARFPVHRDTATFFVTRPGPGAQRLALA